MANIGPRMITRICGGWLMVTLLAFPSVVTAQAVTEFSGLPSVKISEGGTERVPEQVEGSEAVNLASVISRIGDNYYWASRENTRMVRVESGAYVTYIAVNGSGYVRIIASDLNTAFAFLGITEARFDYVEHLLIGLKSVTYYGVRK